MSAETIKASFAVPTMISEAYLGDLTDEELFVRPVEGANHIAWQLGHLIASENHMINQVRPDSMPPLPDGFAEKHSKETSAVDDPAKFQSKEEYLTLMQEQRAGTIAVLDSMSEDDLNSPSPEALQRLGSNLAGIFIMQGVHWTMHAGQWAVIRRKLGRPPLF